MEFIIHSGFVLVAQNPLEVIKNQNKLKKRKTFLSRFSSKDNYSTARKPVGVSANTSQAAIMRITPEPSSRNQRLNQVSFEDH